jgi:CspA family cold shock protein
MLGTVKFFNEKKGWGFIQSQDGRGIFVHFTAIEGEGHTSLQEGDKVEFDIIEGKKGKEQAAKVRKIS